MGRGATHCLVTLVERVSGLAIIKKVAARNKALTTRAITGAIQRCGIKCDTITF